MWPPEKKYLGNYLVIYKARVLLTCGHCVKLVEADSSIEMDVDAAAGCEK